MDPCPVPEPDPRICRSAYEGIPHAGSVGVRGPDPTVVLDPTAYPYALEEADDTSPWVVTKKRVKSFGPALEPGRHRAGRGGVSKVALPTARDGEFAPTAPGLLEQGRADTEARRGDRADKTAGSPPSHNQVRSQGLRHYANPL
jgi:hypothetical protein